MPLSSSRDGLVRTARPLTETNATITRVRWLLIALTLGGALAAGLLGRLAANAVLRPVRALAGAVREVSATRDLNQRIPVSGRDELASLAADFNAMLAALDESQHAQQQLIADASHELRTPLTAHRANIELLARPDLPVEQRQRVLGAAVRAMERLSALVGDLIQAARDGRSVDAREPLALDELVAAAVERAQHRASELRFESRLEPYRFVGARSRLERAVDNVLDNAIKWSPPGGTVEVRLADGSLTVRDHGPGIAEADLPHVFDRFYRAAAARALPGSGLGLAIVKQTVDDHGGSVTVANADGGGALLTLRFARNGQHSRASLRAPASSLVGAGTAELHHPSSSSQALSKLRHDARRRSAQVAADELLRRMTNRSSVSSPTPLTSCAARSPSSSRSRRPRSPTRTRGRPPCVRWARPSSPPASARNDCSRRCSRSPAASAGVCGASPSTSPRLPPRSCEPTIIADSGARRRSSPPERRAIRS